MNLLKKFFKSKPKVSLEDVLNNAMVDKCRTCKYYTIHKKNNLPDIELCRKTTDISIEHFMRTRNDINQYNICIKHGFIYYEEKMID